MFQSFRASFACFCLENLCCVEIADGRARYHSEHMQFQGSLSQGLHASVESNYIDKVHTYTRGACTKEVTRSSESKWKILEISNIREENRKMISISLKQSYATSYLMTHIMAIRKYWHLQNTLKNCLTHE